MSINYNSGKFIILGILSSENFNRKVSNTANGNKTKARNDDKDNEKKLLKDANNC